MHTLIISERIRQATSHLNDQRNDQREAIFDKSKEELIMLEKVKGTDLFCQYYGQWITVYKDGAIRKVTMDKYLMTKKWLEKLILNHIICDLNRITYQQLLNDYATWHERQTTMDFRSSIKSCDFGCSG